MSTKKKYTKQQAQQVVDAMWDSFDLFEDKMLEIMDNQLWLVLGYDSCHAFFAGRMQGTSLSTHLLKATVAYQMYREGLNAQEVASRTGMTPNASQALKEDYDTGVPESLASPALKGRRRRKDEQPTHKTVIVELPVGEYNDYARRVGGSHQLNELGVELYRKHFKK